MGGCVCSLYGKCVMFAVPNLPRKLSSNSDVLCHSFQDEHSFKTHYDILIGQWHCGQLLP